MRIVDFTRGVLGSHVPAFASHESAVILLLLIILRKLLRVKHDAAAAAASFIISSQISIRGGWKAVGRGLFGRESTSLHGQKRKRDREETEIFRIDTLFARKTRLAGAH